MATKKRGKRKRKQKVQLMSPEEKEVLDNTEWRHAYFFRSVPWGWRDKQVLVYDPAEGEPIQLAKLAQQLFLQADGTHTPERLLSPMLYCPVDQTPISLNGAVSKRLAALGVLKQKGFIAFSATQGEVTEEFIHPLGYE